MVLTDFS